MLLIPRMFQWHPAFYACTQIEFSKETGGLCFDNEYQLGTKLVRHLKEEWHLCVEEQEAGIYYIKGDIFPMQLIVTNRLSPEKNLWLSSLTNNLPQGENMERLLQEYGKHSDDNLYRSAMNLIVRANRERFEEGREMCEALMELFKDDIEAAQQKGRVEGRLEGRLEGRMEGILAMIEDYLEEGFSVGKIMEKLEKRFGLTPQEAQKYLEKYDS